VIICKTTLHFFGSHNSTFHTQQYRLLCVQHPTWGNQVPAFMFPRECGPVIPRGAGFLFALLITSTREDRLSQGFSNFGFRMLPAVLFERETWAYCMKEAGVWGEGPEENTKAQVGKGQENVDTSLNLLFPLFGVEWNRIHYCWGHNWPIVPAADYGWWWVWSSRWNAWQGTPKNSEKTCPSAPMSPQIPHDWPELEPAPS
jgi:hypothetical protein